MDLKYWLTEHGLTVRELALQLEAPLKTVEDWVYRGAEPSAKNKERLAEFIGWACTHHWVIETANGPSSGGVCQRCGQTREFRNSAEVIPWQSANQHNKAR